MAWQLDRDLYGPERPTVRDIEPLNRVFSESFTDRYRRDGLLGVRVPHLNPLIWRYALEDAGDGAMVWRDGDGELAGFNVVHFSGSEGWMGPLAVRPDRQGIGLGKEMIRSGIDWLHGKAVQTIGLGIKVAIGERDLIGDDGEIAGRGRDLPLKASGDGAVQRSGCGRVGGFPEW